MGLFGFLRGPPDKCTPADKSARLQQSQQQQVAAASAGRAAAWLVQPTNDFEVAPAVPSACTPTCHSKSQEPDTTTVKAAPGPRPCIVALCTRHDELLLAENGTVPLGPTLPAKPDPKLYLQKVQARASLQGVGSGVGLASLPIDALYVLTPSTVADGAYNLSSISVPNYSLTALPGIRPAKPAPGLARSCKAAPEQAWMCTDKGLVNYKHSGTVLHVKVCNVHCSLSHLSSAFQLQAHSTARTLSDKVQELIADCAHLRNELEEREMQLHALQQQQDKGGRKQMRQKAKADAVPGSASYKHPSTGLPQASIIHEANSMLCSHDVGHLPDNADDEEASMAVSSAVQPQQQGVEDSSSCQTGQGGSYSGEVRMPEWAKAVAGDYGETTGSKQLDEAAQSGTLLEGQSIWQGPQCSESMTQESGPIRRGGPHSRQAVHATGSATHTLPPGRLSVGVRASDQAISSMGLDDERTIEQQGAQSCSLQGRPCDEATSSSCWDRSDAGQRLSHTESQQLLVRGDALNQQLQESQQDAKAAWQQVIALQQQAQKDLAHQAQLELDCKTAQAQRVALQAELTRAKQACESSKGEAAALCQQQTQLQEQLQLSGKALDAANQQVEWLQGELSRCQEALQRSRSLCDTHMASARSALQREVSLREEVTRLHTSLTQRDQQLEQLQAQYQEQQHENELQIRCTAREPAALHLDELPMQSTTPDSLSADVPLAASPVAAMFQPDFAAAGEDHRPASPFQPNRATAGDRRPVMPFGIFRLASPSPGVPRISLPACDSASGTHTDSSHSCTHSSHSGASPLPAASTGAGAPGARAVGVGMSGLPGLQARHVDGLEPLHTARFTNLMRKYECFRASPELGTLASVPTAPLAASPEEDTDAGAVAGEARPHMVTACGLSPADTTSMVQPSAGSLQAPTLAGFGPQPQQVQGKELPAQVGCPSDGHSVVRGPTEASGSYSFAPGSDVDQAGSHGSASLAGIMQGQRALQLDSMDAFEVGSSGFRTSLLQGSCSSVTMAAVWPVTVAETAAADTCQQKTHANMSSQSHLQSWCTSVAMATATGTTMHTTIAAVACESPQPSEAAAGTTDQCGVASKEKHRLATPQKQQDAVPDSDVHKTPDQRSKQAGHQQGRLQRPAIPMINLAGAGRSPSVSGSEPGSLHSSTQAQQLVGTPSAGTQTPGFVATPSSIQQKHRYSSVELTPRCEMTPRCGEDDAQGALHTARSKKVTPTSGMVTIVEGLETPFVTQMRTASESHGRTPPEDEEEDTYIDGMQSPTGSTTLTDVTVMPSTMLLSPLEVLRGKGSVSQSQGSDVGASGHAVETLQITRSAQELAQHGTSHVVTRTSASCVLP